MASENSASEDESNVFVVEEIRDVRNKKGKKQYLIKWKGYSDAENTWEDEDNILDQDLIQRFHDSQKAKKRKSEPIKSTVPKKQPRVSEPVKVDKPVDTSQVIEDTHALYSDELPETVLNMADWSSLVASVDSISRHDNFDNIFHVYLSWKDGKKTNHLSTTLRNKCPGLLLDYYESHLKFKAAN